MLIETFLPISEVREKCAVVGTSADDLLIRHRAAATAHVERIVRRNVLDRVVTANAIPQWTDGQRRQMRPPLQPDAHQPIVFQVADAKSLGAETLAVTYRIESETSSFERDGEIRVPPAQVDIRQDRVLVVQNEWPTNADLSIPYQATFTVGMKDGDAPPEYQTAALFLTREMFFGSMLDQLKPGIVEQILRDHVAISYNSLDADFLTAEVTP